jgi:hypothetical protein
VSRGGEPLEHLLFGMAGKERMDWMDLDGLYYSGNATIQGLEP